MKYEKVAIVDHPPSLAELKKMLKFHGGNIKKLFSTNGVQFKELGLADKIDTMSEAQALALLSKNGKLVKRPFVLTNDGKGDAGLIGYKEDEWKKQF